MTTPILSSVDLKTGGRIYTNEEGKTFVSVTTALNAVPKQMHLTKWAARLTAERALEFISEATTSCLETALETFGLKADDNSLLDWLKSASQENMQEAGERGDIIHDTLDKMLEYDKDKILGLTDALLEDLTKEQKKMTMQFLDWYVKSDYELVDKEFTVFNDKYGYAGSCDLLLRDGDGNLCYCDFKTGKYIHREVALQLAAYAYGEYIVDGETMKRKPLLPVTSGTRLLAFHIKKTKMNIYEVNNIAYSLARFVDFLRITKQYLRLDDDDFIGKIDEHKYKETK